MKRSVRKHRIWKHGGRIGFFVALVCLLCAHSVAFAAAGGAHHGPGGIEETFPFWPNFVLFCFIFYFLIRKPVSNFWLQRCVHIENAVHAGERELEAAEARLSEAKQKLSHVAEEIQQLEKTIAEESEHEAQRILTDSSEKAQRIQDQVKGSIEAERRTAEAGVRRELAELVISKARSKLENEFTEEGDKRLRNSALQGLRGLVQ